MAQPVLFSDTPGMLPIWTWECNLEALYTVCSPEIILCLGITPEKSLGESIYSFHIHPDTSVLLKDALSKGKVPAELPATFISSKDEPIKGKINIFELKNEDGKLVGWHGFNQIFLPDNAEFSIPFESPANISVEKLPQSINTSRTGIALDHGHFKTPSTFWTETAQHSFNTHLPQIENGKPAVIAVPFRFGSYGTGLLEIVDDTHTRTWSKGEKQLVEGVITQLTSTLEKLLLQAILEKENRERTRAEEEILRRNQDLAKLAQIGQQLGKLSSSEEVFHFLYTTMGEMIDNQNMTIALYNKDKEVIFPFVSSNGNIVSIQKDPFVTSILRYVTTEKEPLLVTGTSIEEFEKYHITPPERIPAALIAVPMLAGERPVGTIILQDFQNYNAYNFIHLELLSTIAGQATAAIENANLFQEIRDALKAIEVRELYQANIGRAVATLSQNGTQSLNTFLELIGKATQCSRVSYIQYFEAGDENRWKTIKTWNAPDYIPSLSITADYQTSIDSLPHEENYPEKGWISGTLLGKPGLQIKTTTPPEIGSFLLLTVPGKSLWRSYVSIEQMGCQRVWKNEEINILKVAADALSNTIIREGLMEQLQASLNETESLYNASHHLALANNVKEMLASLSVNLAAPQINKSILVLFEHDENERINSMNDIAIWQHNKTGTLVLNPTEFLSLDFLPVFQRSTPVFFDDVRLAPIEENLRTALINRSILAMTIMPLWAGKRQLGFMLLCSDRPYHFSNREMRTYPPLVDQMAIAIENAHAYELSQQAVREMKEVEKLKGQFLATMTHELRSPLNSIIGFSQVILKGIDGPINDMQTHDLSAIYESGQLLLSLINDVLDVSKLEAGKMELALSIIDMEEIIDAALSSTQGLIKNKPIKIKKEIKRPLPNLTADPIRIRQVLINLLSNAAKFTEVGNITVKAWFETPAEGQEKIWVTVTDTGMGIAPENQKKLFQAFTQVDSSHTRKTGGSGLGLSICYSLIDLHHGQIGILQSVPNQGSTFFFTLPLNQPSV